MVTAISDSKPRASEIRALYAAASERPTEVLSGGPWSLAGGPYLFAPDVPDRRALVREALLQGYRDCGPAHVIADT